jgi:flagellin-like hook-associated protein FlgL
MADITLASGLRPNLLNLQKTAAQMSTVQNRLATGKKVNSALDNPTNFFTASSLSARAGDLGNLLDGLSNGIQVLQAADNGLTSITNTLESMQSTVRQARQDKSWESKTFAVDKAGLDSTAAAVITFTGGAFASAQTLTLNKAGANAVGDKDDTWTVDEIVTAINSDTNLSKGLKASNDNGTLRLKNLSTVELEVAGGSALETSGTATATDKVTIDGNATRSNLVTQFNELRDQLDKIADDSSFNGVNLLQGDLLTLTFNESGTSTLDIQRTGGKAINSVNLGQDQATNKEFESDTSLDARLNKLTTSLNTIRSQASSFGSNLSMVQNRQDFSKTMINTLKSGADNLTLADQNEEAANMLSLQTRQQLSQTALSLANQANQGVLRLF